MSDDGFFEQWGDEATCPVCGEELDAVVRAGKIGRMSGVEVCSVDGDLILHDLPSKFIEASARPVESGPTVVGCCYTMREGSEPLFRRPIEPDADQNGDAQ